ncbi:NB-ARC domain-containing protein [Nostoc sp. DedQUE09]|uniref:NB-ARC domain-containing protein n=1 Tax=Nostoc sp. DedQUE09 TaxID=3075394 RepID=UPI002AD27796|nr:NB-ARC domain-containing protein [Nostoc sp. DedQUE09]MDZ7955391.1 NB-ARC domain-containing protein [Nostoc sp. DedQUE09]
MSTIWAASEEGIQLVKTAIKSKGLSQTDFCKKLQTEAGISKSTYDRLCRGENIRLENLEVICDLLKLDVEKVKKILVSSSLESIPDIPVFYGRDKELAELKSQITNNQRVVIISGIPGVGKTSISVKIVNHFMEEQGKFKHFFWRDVKNSRDLKDLIYSILEPFVTEKELNEVHSSNDGGIFQLTKFLMKEPCLIILNSWNDLFKERELAGCYKEGFEDYGELLKRIAKINHNSCIVITTSEEPRELTELQNNSQIYSMKLEGLDLNNYQNLFNSIPNNSEIITGEVIDFCKGNPLAMRIFVNKCQSLLGDGKKININQLKTFFYDDWVELQYKRLSDIEQNIVDFFTLKNGVSKRACLFQEDNFNLLKTTYTDGDLDRGIYSLIKRDLIHIIEGDEIYYELNYYILNYVVVVLWTEEIKKIGTVPNTRIFDLQIPIEDVSILGDNQSPKTIDGIRREIENIIKDDKLTVSKKWDKIKQLQI